MNRVEKLSPENVADAAEIGESFATEANYPGGFSLTAFQAQWRPLLESGMGEIFVVRVAGRAVGIMGAAFIPDSFSGWLTGMENFWYVLPEHRKGTVGQALFHAFEAEALRRGCKRLVMVRLEGPFADKLDEFYARNGYSPVEKTFEKVI